MNTNSFKRTRDKRFINVLWIASAAVIMAWVITPATASAQRGPIGNLVVNCGFETGTFSGWTVAWTDPSTFVPPVTANCAHSGSYCAALGAVPGWNQVSQTLNENTPTKYPAGTVFTVSFWLNNQVGACCKNYFEARWNDTTLMVISEATVPTGYTHYSFQVVGTGGTRDTLSFIEENQPSFFFLDDVNVVPGGPPPYIPNVKN